ncbi:MAG TPA: hypothetical protein VNU00_02250 [Candidatus Binataceae bacterium]|nr:hypothetical protein [Candidatus Binataceae bacterium]
METPPRSPATQDEWRLGVDPETIADDESAITYSAPALSADRLKRPVVVVTVERLAWLLIAAWALITRLVAVGARPLTASEARGALFAYDLANRTSEAAAAGFHPASSGWIHLVQAGIFAAFGASDFTARLLFVLTGLLLVAMSFEMRHYIGRAGAIAMGATLAISPTVTWFSRSAGNAIVAGALAVVAIALFSALQAQPSRGRAAALGIAGGLMIASGPAGIVLAASLIGALALLGVGALVTTRNVWLRARVWLDRYASFVAIVIVIAIAITLGSQALVGLPLRGLAADAAILATPRIANLVPGLLTAVLPLGFYEFTLVLTAAAGLVVVCAARVRTRFAYFTLLWTTLSFFLYLSIPHSAPDQILIVIVPAAILSAVAIDYLHNTDSWRYVRYGIAALISLSLHAQTGINFANAAPDASEPAWARHATLYWGDEAATIQAVDQCHAVLKPLAPPDLTVFHEGTWPVSLRWYLRRLRPVTAPDVAAIAVDTNHGQPASDVVRTYQFDYAESWTADPHTLDAHRAVLYFFLQRPWSEVVTRDATITVRAQAAGSAPTLILPPAGP